MHILERCVNARLFLGQAPETLLRAQIELRKGLPFEVTMQAAPMLSSEAQAAALDGGIGRLLMAAAEPQAGEVWYADLGIAEKSRPVLVLAYPRETDARSLVIVVPLTSQLRGMRGEVDLGKPRWLPKRSAANVQGLASFDPHKLARRMGALTKSEMDRVKEAVRDLLDL